LIKSLQSCKLLISRTLEVIGHEKVERDCLTASGLRHGLRCGVDRASVAHDQEGAITVKRDRRRSRLVLTLEI